MFDSSRTVPAPPLRVSRWIDAEIAKWKRVVDAKKISLEL